MTQEQILTGNELIGKFMGLYLGVSPYYNDTIPERGLKYIRTKSYYIECRGK